MDSFATLNILFYFVIFWQMDTAYSGNQQGDSVWKTTIACYGADNRCSTYKMQCEPKQKIALGTLLYGTKHIGQCLYGVSDCPKSAIICCKFNESDTLTPFSESDRVNVSENCSGKDKCEGLAPRLSSIPYSVYVIMKYTCVDDTSTVKFCEPSKSERVNHSFLEFNLPRDFAFPSMNGSRDCSCMVLGQSCNSEIEITYLVMDFERPMLRTGPVGCSGSSLFDKRLGSSFNCSSIRRDSLSFTVTSYDVMSMKDLFSADYNDRPTHVLILVTAHSGGFIDVQCGQPGVSFDPHVNCPTTSVSVTSSSTRRISSTSTTTNASSNTPIIPPNTPTAPQSTMQSSSPYTTTSSPVTPPNTTGSLYIATSTRPAVTPSSTRTSSSSTTTPLSETSSKTTQTSTRKPAVSLSKDKIKTSISSSHISTPSATTGPKGYTFIPKRISKSSHIVSKTTSADFTPNGINYTANSPTSQSTVADSLYVTHPAATTYSTTTTENKVVPTIDDDSIDKGLIIGLIIGILAALTIIVAVIVCLCIRIKRKEKYRRNYVRNTNIFYSFPEDLKDIGSTESDCKTVETIEKDDALIIETNAMYEPFDGIAAPYDTCSEFDISNYIIDPSVNNSKIVLVSEDVYSPESSTDSDNEINVEETNTNVEKDTRTDTSKETKTKSDTKTDNQKAVETVLKKSPRKNSRVTFDPSTLYASVNKEAKTKF